MNPVSALSEGDHMIVMAKPSAKAVVLLGDPEQFPPTIISENSQNAEVEYVKRPLIERLQKAWYPCTMLLTNYRCHPLWSCLTVWHTRAN
jgi:superfamily I DNA and/or RNA helicase